MTPETLNSKAGSLKQSCMSAGELLPPYKVLEAKDHTTYRRRIRDRLNGGKGRKKSAKSIKKDRRESRRTLRQSAVTFYTDRRQISLMKIGKEEVNLKVYTPSELFLV